MTALALDTVQPWTPPAPVDIAEHRAQYLDRLRATVADLIASGREDQAIRQRGVTLVLPVICSSSHCIKHAEFDYLGVPFCTTCRPHPPCDGLDHCVRS